MIRKPTFPPSPEIKRVIAAVTRAGVSIGTIEIEPKKIKIIPLQQTDDSSESDYDVWLRSQPRPRQR